MISQIRIRIKLKSREPWKLTMEPLRLIQEPWRLAMELWRLTFKPWRACRLLLQIRFTLLRIRIRIQKVGSSSNCKIGCGSATLGVTLRIRNAVLTLSWTRTCQVKAFHLNLEGEGVIMCENVDCNWPFGSVPIQRHVQTN